MSMTSLSDRLAQLLPCEDNSCCCIPKRSTVISISIINFLGCLMDLSTIDDCTCGVRRVLAAARKMLVTFFQVANVLLLLAAYFEKPLAVDVYVWFTLAYVVMSFVVSIYEFVVRAKCSGYWTSLLTFVPEVVFLFVIFRCLPLVDLYRRHLYSVAAIPPCSREVSPVPSEVQM